jgi:hypothetical protein
VEATIAFVHAGDTDVAFAKVTGDLTSPMK